MIATVRRRNGRRKLVGFAALTTVMLSVLAVPEISNAAVLDASCIGATTSTFGTTGDARAAQTFSALTTGSLVGASAPINKTGTPGDWVMRISDTDAGGIPLNTVLGSATIPDATVPDGDSTITGTFTPGVAVTAGHLYALVLTRPGSDHLLWDQRGPGDPCPGQMFKSSTQTGTWGAFNPGVDFLFAVSVDPPNDFSIGKVKGRRVSLTVPGAGVVLARDASGPAGAQAHAAAGKKLLKKSTATASGAGILKLTLNLTKWAKNLLAAKGTLKVKTAITFTPTNGTPNTKTAKLKLKQK